ncbi:MAG: hypothetical protein GC153_12485 [Alphaproteobacteria bacterium]|nr:hypothetical protein [Alphaproteobacteria bacterium]
MIRITTILLCLMLAAAAWGRYRAEASVREARREIHTLDQEKAKELSSIQTLRAEVAFLESPDRLAKIASDVTDLEPLASNQLLTAEDFVAEFGSGKTPAPVAPSRSDGDFVAHALAMADTAPAE